MPEFIRTADGPSVDGASPDLLRRLLEEVESTTRSMGLDADAWFRPGLDAATVRSELGSAGLACPEELEVWFGWHDGYEGLPAPQPPAPLPNFDMASLGTALLDTEVPQGLSHEGLEFGAGEGWLRLIHGNWGLAIECSRSRTVRIHCATEDFDYEPTHYRAVSLCTYAAWWLYGLRNGAYRIDPDTGRWLVETSLLARTQRAALFW